MKFYFTRKFQGTINHPLSVLPDSEQDLVLLACFTYLFYQVCRVHDIFYFGDQSAIVGKSWHLSFRYFCLKLMFNAVTIQDTSFRQKCLKRQSEWQSKTHFYEWVTCISMEVFTWDILKMTSLSTSVNVSLFLGAPGYFNFFSLPSTPIRDSWKLSFEFSIIFV